MAFETNEAALGSGAPPVVEPIAFDRGRARRPAAAFRMAPEAARPVHTTGELEEQLRKRLRVESIIWAIATGGVALVALTVRRDLYADRATIFTTPPMPGVLALIAIATLGVVRLLRPNRTLGLAKLRMLEWGGVIVTAAFLIVDEALDLRTMTAVIDVKPLDLALGLGAPWGALIVAYGVLIPSNLRHAFVRTSVLVGCAFLPEAIAFTQLGGLVPGAGMYLAIKCLTVLIFAALALYGSYHIDELREDVRSARQLGHYVLVRALGQGGMGSVYLAEHNFLRRPCAVKLIRPELARDDAAHARFEREVQAAAALTHPNTVQIYDYGQAEDGTLYYAMEYLPGESLESLVERSGPLEPARAVRILEQLCGALGEAHARGLVHRDVKPGNIMLCERGGIPEVVKLLDFGSVAALRTGPEDPRITRSGMIVGTPAFMSPEQCRGDETLTPLSDIYSVGAVAFFLLTGKEPFYRKLTAVEVMAAQIYEFPPSIHELRPEVPIELAAVVEKCLAKDPFERIPNAGRLGRALGAAAGATHNGARAAVT
jgi:serine/threonine-protein kinase